MRETRLQTVTQFHANVREFRGLLKPKFVSVGMMRIRLQNDVDKLSERLLVYAAMLLELEELQLVMTAKRY